MSKDLDSFMDSASYYWEWWNDSERLLDDKKGYEEFKENIQKW